LGYKEIRDKFMVKFSLRNKLLFFSVLIALIPLGIAAYTNISITRDELKSSVNEETSMVAGALSMQIDEMYRDTWSAPLLLIRNAVDNENLGATEKEAILKNFINDVPDIVSIQLSAEGVPTPLLIVVQNHFIQKLDEAGLDPISVVRVGPESISRLLDPERGSNPDLTYIPETDTWMMTMVLSMKRKIFKRVVTLSARVTLNRLRERIVQYNKSRRSKITLVDMTGKKIFDPKRSDLTELAIVKAALQLLSSGSRVITVEPYTRPNGDKMLGAFSFPSYFDWAVIVEETEADAYIAITKMVLRLILMALLAFCLAALVAIWVAQRISRPIVKIGKVAQLVGRGDFTVRVSGIKTRDEINDLGKRMNEMIEGLHERFQLQKFVSDQTIDAIRGADEKGVKLGGQRKKATVFFSDIRGFTEFSEKVEPEAVIEMLNTYLRVQASIVREYNGDIDKYVGDELVALFQGEDMVQNAVLAAVEIQTQTAALNEAHPEWDIGIGIGINTGEMVMGAMGSEDRMDFTILGDAVNLGSRLCSHATRDQILLTEASCEEIEGVIWIQTDKLDPIMVKGKSHPIPIYEVVGAQPQTKGRQARVEVRWPCTLRTAHKSINAELRDISAGGALVYLQDQAQLDETFQIVIMVPDGKPLETAIEVVWSDMIEEDTPRRFGAKFTKISQEDRRFLLEVISQIRARSADHQKK
jgi:adenylate cyclase